MMSGSEGVVAKKKRTRVLFFLVDTSNSMANTIRHVKNVICGVIAGVDAISEKIGIEYKAAVLTFSEGAEWHNHIPLDVKNANGLLNNLECKGVGKRYAETDLGGIGTNYGEAYRELNEKLSQGIFIDNPSTCLAPSIILIAGSEPADNYKAALETLKGNALFKIAFKCAIALGPYPEEKTLIDFADKYERAENDREISKHINMISFNAALSGFNVDVSAKVIQQFLDVVQVK